MAMQREEIIHLIEKAFPDAEINLKALVADGDHYEAHIVSSAFKGKTRIQQHQMVYQALGERMGNELHALSVRTSIPESDE
jgi:stress-induced morphogen